jgi:signal transduction histidine kinase
LSGRGPAPDVAGRRPAPAGAPVEAKRVSRTRPTLLALPWWHGGFAVAVGFTAAWTLLDGPLGDRRSGALAMYVALAGWYVLAPDGLARRGEGRIYLVGALALFAGAAACAPDAGFLLFALIPQCFVVLEPRGAWVAVTGLALVTGASQLEAHGATRGDAISVALGGTMTVVLSLLINGWVTRIAEQSEQRADLIDELDRTRTELARVSRAAGMAAERERLAGEIHDTLAQGFISILMLLQAAQAGLPEDGGAPGSPVRRQLELAEASAREGLAEARSLVDALAPVALQEASLAEAIERVGEDLGQRSGVLVRFEVLGAPRPLPASTEVVLLRGAQEALANVRRHAAATEVIVTLAYDTRGSRLTVVDDGRGFEPAEAVGFGLRGMRARVEQAGGRLQVCSAPGRGSTVELHLP